VTSVKRDAQRRVYWPYCIEQLEAGRYVLLNRRYKPLGIASRTYIRDYSPWSFRLSITAADAQQMSWDGSDDVSRVYFYNDGTIPTDGRQKLEAYEARLTRLASIGGPDLRALLHPSPRSAGGRGS
jgi:hypothetical protein